MSLVVQKFGGSSVADAASVIRVANRIAKYARAGHEVVVVVSAMGDTTDELIDLAEQVTATAETFEEEAMKLAVARYKYRGVRDQDIYDFMRRHGHRPGGAGLDMRFWMTVNRLRQDPAVIAAHPQLTAELNRRVEAAG